MPLSPVIGGCRRKQILRYFTAVMLHVPEGGAIRNLQSKRSFQVCKMLQSRFIERREIQFKSGGKTPCRDRKIRSAEKAVPPDP